MVSCIKQGFSVFLVRKVPSGSKSLKLLCRFNADTCLQHSGQQIIPHNMLKCENYRAGFGETLRLSKKPNPSVVNII
jgi:hypothetical protein